jgi:hypothetical protein
LGEASYDTILTAIHNIYDHLLGRLDHVNEVRSELLEQARVNTQNPGEQDDNSEENNDV